MLTPQNSYISTPAPQRTPGNPHIGPLVSAARAQGTSGLVDLLDVVVSNRLKKSWRVMVDYGTGTRVLSVPPVLADPPPDVRDALIRWAMLPVGPRVARNPAYVRKKKGFEAVIRGYLESRGVSSVRKCRMNPEIFRHQTKGFVFDLREVFDTLNRAYFNNEIESYIRWGRTASRTSYQDTRLDKNGRPFNLITISGVYDAPRVPEYAIYGLVYHEMLHIAIPPKTVNGRRVIHGREFRAAMKKYPFEAEWAAWERENMPKLIMNSRRRLKRLKSRNAATG